MEVLDANMRLLDYLDPALASRLSYFETKMQDEYSKLAKSWNDNLLQEIITRLKTKHKCRVTKANFKEKYLLRLSIKMDKDDPFCHMIYLDKKKFVVKFSNKINVETKVENGRHKAILTIG